MKPKLIATFSYRLDGNVVYEKQRWEPGFDGRSKTFRFRRPLPDRLRADLGVPPGVAAWVMGITAGVYVRRGDDYVYYPQTGQDAKDGIAIDQENPILYRLPELRAASPLQPVFVTEGEKDVEILRALRFTATCGPYGSSTWLHQWSSELAGRRVVVVPDNNPVGYDHADRVVGSLIRAGVASVRVIHWGEGRYDPGPGGGAGNWLARIEADREARTGRDAMIELALRAKEYCGVGTPRISPGATAE